MGVAVGDGVALGVRLGDGVALGVSVGWRVSCGAWVATAVGVWLAVAVAVGSSVAVGVWVGSWATAVGVGKGVGVAEVQPINASMLVNNTNRRKVDGFIRCLKLFTEEVFRFGKNKVTNNEQGDGREEGAA